MKKYVYLLIIVIIALTSIAYLYINYVNGANNISSLNKDYESLYNNVISGTTFATNINKILDANSKNNVQKDENGYYLDNGENSIIVEIKFKDSDNIFRIEQIYKNNISKFINLYLFIYGRLCKFTFFVFCNQKKGIKPFCKSNSSCKLPLTRRLSFVVKLSNPAPHT